MTNSDQTPADDIRAALAAPPPNNDVPPLDCVIAEIKSLTKRYGNLDDWFIATALQNVIDIIVLDYESRYYSTDEMSMTLREIRRDAADKWGFGEAVYRLKSEFIDRWVDDMLAAR